MQSFLGKPVYKGIAMGPVVVLKHDDFQVKRKKAEDTEAEIIRLEQAKEQAEKQLQVLHDKAVKEVGEDSAAIFEVHQMMLEDEDYLDAIGESAEFEAEIGMDYNSKEDSYGSYYEGYSELDDLFPETDYSFI